MELKVWGLGFGASGFDSLRNHVYTYQRRIPHMSALPRAAVVESFYVDGFSCTPSLTLRPIKKKFALLGSRYPYFKGELVGWGSGGRVVEHIKHGLH